MELLKLNRLILLEANGELESNGPIELMKLAYCEVRRSQFDHQEVPKYVRYKAETWLSELLKNPSKQQLAWLVNDYDRCLDHIL